MKPNCQASIVRAMSCWTKSTGRITSTLDSKVVTICKIAKTASTERVQRVVFRASCRRTLFSRNVNGMTVNENGEETMVLASGCGLSIYCRWGHNIGGQYNYPCTRVPLPISLNCGNFKYCILNKSSASLPFMLCIHYFVAVQRFSWFIHVEKFNLNTII